MPRGCLDRVAAMLHALASAEQGRNALHEDQLKDKVHESEDRGQEEDEDQDLDRRVLELLTVGPRDLPHLGHDFLVEVRDPRREALAVLNDLDGHYFVSLWSLWALQRGQYFFHSTRSGWRR